jgi:RNA polymerase sigma-70 factor (ECF subfamily)
MSDEEDATLMCRYVRGDARAFERLYQRHRGPLYRYLMRHTRNTDTANDLFQEAWSKLIATRERYEPRAKFQTFLFHIAHNCFIDHCRRRGARPAGADDAALESLAAPATTQPDRHAESSQILMRYRAALASLPAEQRDVFLLHEESGLSLEEIARISGVGAETAKSRLRYALAKLRAALEPHREPPLGANFEGARS